MVDVTGMSEEYSGGGKEIWKALELRKNIWKGIWNILGLSWKG